MIRRLIIYILFMFVLWSLGCGREQETNSENEPNSENAMLKLVNDIRQQGTKCGNTYYPAIHKLNWNTKLVAAAQAHANDMFNSGTLSHQGSDNSRVGDRVTRQKYSWRRVGENISRGYPSARSAVQGWLNSEGHCKNIMDSRFTEMGMAQSGSFWVQVFGAR